VNSCGTGKRRYCDETAALARLADRRLVGRGRAGHDVPPAGLPPRSRAYACPLCSGWHLTVTTHHPRRPM
jgi:hypothetical protein